MIPEFILSCIVVAFVLYLPGFFIRKATRLSQWEAFAFAPFVSIPAYCILGIIYEKAGLTASALSIGLPVLIVSLVVFRRERWSQKKATPEYRGYAKVRTKQPWALSFAVYRRGACGLFLLLFERDANAWGMSLEDLR